MSTEDKTFAGRTGREPGTGIEPGEERPSADAAAGAHTGIGSGAGPAAHGPSADAANTHTGTYSGEGRAGQRLIAGAQPGTGSTTGPPGPRPISENGAPGRIRRLLRFVWESWKLNLAGAMEFRLSFLLTAGMMVVNNVVWIIFWGLYFRRFPVINGWELQDVMMLWAVAAGGFGLMAVLFGNAMRIANLVATGQLDIYLAQPKPVLLNVLISRMSVSAIGDILFAFLIYAAFGDKSLPGLLKFALALLLATMIFIFFTVIVNSLAFWLGNTEGLSFQLFNALLTFATYPTGIFRGLGKLVLFTVIPAGFISYLPIGLLRGVDSAFLAGGIGMTALLTALGIVLFYRGLRRYSSGNMLTLRR